MFILSAEFYSFCPLFFLCEAARWASCLNERGFIKKLKLKHFNFNIKVSKMNIILKEMIKSIVKWCEFTHRCPPRPFWAQTRPRPHWSWPCPSPSLSCWTEETHTPTKSINKSLFTCAALYLSPHLSSLPSQWGTRESPAAGPSHPAAHGNQNQSASFSFKL